jgi:hypothetical protein
MTCFSRRLAGADERPSPGINAPAIEQRRPKTGSNTLRTDERPSPALPSPLQEAQLDSQIRSRSGGLAVQRHVG